MSDLVDQLVESLERELETEGARNPMTFDINFRERIHEKLIKSYENRLLYWTGPRQVGERQTVEFIGNQAYEHVRELMRLHGGSKLVRPSSHQARMQYV